MKVIVTGMNGTVAPALARRLMLEGAEIVTWDRGRDAPETEAAVREFISRYTPDWVCHVATGAPDWAEWIARTCAGSDVRLLWTGSVSVFGEKHRPPFTTAMEPDATDDYGRYKVECEKRVRAANPDAIVARLGWQIGDAPGSNTMTNYLTNLARENGGKVEASAAWIPSCAKLDDSAGAMAELMSRGKAGLYQLEGNQHGLSLFEIASGLKKKLGTAWEVVRADEPRRDNRMKDEQVRMGQVVDWLVG